MNKLINLLTEFAYKVIEANSYVLKITDDMDLVEDRFEEEVDNLVQEYRERIKDNE